MNLIFEDAAERIDVPAILDWKESGGKVMGYTCSFLPLEVLDAAGILPVRLRGIDTGDMGIGDTYFGPFICRFPKALLQNVGQSRYSFLDGAVISTGCDAMRRMDDCWRKAGEDIPGVVPPYFHYFDVPQKAEGHAREWFSGRVRKFISSLEQHFGIRISDEDLAKAIRLRNRIRALLWEMEELRRQETSLVSGSEAFAAVIAGAVLPPAYYAKELEQWLEGLRSPTAKIHKNNNRVLVAGSVSDDLDFIRMLEDAGALVVADNLCFGIRNVDDRVDEDGDPVESLTRRYLSESICPRMFGSYKARWKVLKEKALQAGVKGVILENVRFCDMHAADNGLLQRDFENLGIPVIRVEREYGPLTETGRLKMRFNAFLEQMEAREGNRYAS